MSGRVSRSLRALVAAVLLAGLGEASAADGPATVGPSLIGIDHVPTVVADLEQAGADYRRLGFALKPGRPHDNGLRNLHVKFPDGSGIELLSPPAEPADRMTRAYAAMLREGEGPAYLAFHARDTAALTSALDAAGIGFANADGRVTLDDPRLDFIFFVRDNRSPTDRPEHFAHANGASAMPEVWLAVDEPTLASLRTLFAALGSGESIQIIRAPTHAVATVFPLQNGSVVVVGADRQRIAGREIIGARFHVEGGRSRNTPPVDPSVAHGLWLDIPRRP